MSFTAIVPRDARVVRLATNLAFTEGPVWLEAEQSLLFTDIPHNRIHRWNSRGGLTVWNDNAHFAIGLAVDLAGRVIACEHSTRRLTRRELDGSSVTIASSYGRHALNSTNDACVRRSDGAVFFTDPPFGVCLDDDGALVGYQVGMKYGACGVFKVTDDPARPRLVTNAIHRPNGICFSLNEHSLYVSDSSELHHRVHLLELNDDDTAKSDRVFAVIDAGVPDGMRIDSEDRLYVAALDGVHVFAPAGELIAKIPVPEMVTNLCFGGPDLKTLFITATSSLYALELSVKGVA